MTNKEIILAGNEAYKQKNLNRAKSCFQEILNRHEAGQKTAPLILGIANYNIGRILSDHEDECTKAIPYIEKARIIFQKVELDNELRANMLNLLGTTYYRCGKLNKALIYCKQAVIKAQESYGKNNMKTAALITAYAIVLHDMKKLPEAVKQLNHVKNICSIHSNTIDKSTFQQILDILKNWKNEQSGKIKWKPFISRASQMLFTAVALQVEQVKKKDHLSHKPKNIQVDLEFMSLVAEMSDKEVILAGNTAYERNQLNKAQACFQEILKRQKKKHKLDPIYLAIAYYGLGKIKSLHEKKFSKAIPLMETALKFINEAKLNNCLKADILDSLGLAYYRTHKFDKALEYAKQAVILARKTYGPQDAWTAMYIILYATILHDLKRMPEAIQQLKQAKDILKTLSGEEEQTTLKRTNVKLKTWEEEFSGKRSWTSIISVFPNVHQVSD